MGVFIDISRSFNVNIFISDRMEGLVGDIQLLTLREWSRKHGVNNPYSEEYDYITAYKRNISPDSNGKWPRLEKDDR
ncbi:MAG TPA: hypothetical protein DCM40_37365 [Maribacter sp.]|nr:hypothetical protein [Maribacter sp.]|tara:strand:+ start:236 stop:466 length:231 start_codon:yes stop_codon:yes gene_type:complete